MKKQQNKPKPDNIAVLFDNLNSEEQKLQAKRLSEPVQFEKVEQTEKE